MVKMLSENESSLEVENNNSKWHEISNEYNEDEHVVEVMVNCNCIDNDFESIFENDKYDSEAKYVINNNILEQCKNIIDPLVANGELTEVTNNIVSVIADDHDYYVNNTISNMSENGECKIISNCKVDNTVEQFGTSINQYATNELVSDTSNVTDQDGNVKIVNDLTGGRKREIVTKSVIGKEFTNTIIKPYYANIIIDHDYDVSSRVHNNAAENNELELKTNAEINGENKGVISNVINRSCTQIINNKNVRSVINKKLKNNAAKNTFNHNNMIAKGKYKIKLNGNDFVKCKTNIVHYISDKNFMSDANRKSLNLMVNTRSNDLSNKNINTGEKEDTRANSVQFLKLLSVPYVNKNKINCSACNRISSSCICLQGNQMDVKQFNLRNEIIRSNFKSIEDMRLFIDNKMWDSFISCNTKNINNLRLLNKQIFLNISDMLRNENYVFVSSIHIGNANTKCYPSKRKVQYNSSIKSKPMLAYEDISFNIENISRDEIPLNINDDLETENCTFNNNRVMRCYSKNRKLPFNNNITLKPIMGCEDISFNPENVPCDKILDLGIENFEFDRSGLKICYSWNQKLQYNNNTKFKPIMTCEDISGNQTNANNLSLPYEKIFVNDNVSIANRIFNNNLVSDNKLKFYPSKQKLQYNTENITCDPISIINDDLGNKNCAFSDSGGMQYYSSEQELHCNSKLKLPGPVCEETVKETACDKSNIALTQTVIATHQNTNAASNINGFSDQMMFLPLQNELWKKWPVILTKDLFCLRCPSQVLPIIYMKCRNELTGLVAKRISKENHERNNISVDKGKSQICEGSTCQIKNMYNCQTGRFLTELGTDIVQTYLKECVKTTDSENKISNLDCNQFFRFKLKKCTFCNFKTESITALSDHLRIPHAVGNNYRCNFCDFISRIYKVTKHMQEEHNVVRKLLPPTFSYNCPLCSRYDTNHESHLKTHLRFCRYTINPETNQQLPYDTELPAKCIITKTEDSYYNNTRYLPGIFYNSENVTKIPVLSINSTQNIKRHPLKSNLTQSLPSVIIRVPNVKSKLLVEPQVQNDHKQPIQIVSNSHKGEFIKCELCDSNLADFNDMTVHMNVVHSIKLNIIVNRNYHCKVCNKQFYTEPGLGKHIIREHASSNKILSIQPSTFSSHKVGEQMPSNSIGESKLKQILTVYKSTNDVSCSVGETGPPHDGKELLVSQSSSVPPHYAAHRKRTAWFCNECNQTNPLKFSKRFRYLEHVKTCHMKKFSIFLKRTSPIKQQSSLKTYSNFMKSTNVNSEHFGKTSKSVISKTIPTISVITPNLKKKQSNLVIPLTTSKKIGIISKQEKVGITNPAVLSSLKTYSNNTKPTKIYLEHFGNTSKSVISETIPTTSQILLKQENGKTIPTTSAIILKQQNGKTIPTSAIILKQQNGKTASTTRIITPNFQRNQSNPVMPLTTSKSKEIVIISKQEKISKTNPNVLETTSRLMDVRKILTKDIGRVVKVDNILEKCKFTDPKLYTAIDKRKPVCSRRRQSDITFEKIKKNPLRSCQVSLQNDLQNKYTDSLNLNVKKYNLKRPSICLQRLDTPKRLCLVS